jgi:transcriptional regulator with XRE-family HTH domain
LEVAIRPFFYRVSNCYNIGLKVEIRTLRHLRLAHGLTQEEAAAKCGIASGYWSELEAGKRRGSQKKFEMIARGFGLT